MKEKEYLYGRLGYNAENDRYGLLDSDLWIKDGFHCGDIIEIQVEDEWIATSMEMLWEADGGIWYLTGTPFRGGNLEYLRARIEV